jgi:hypothetical protein
MLDEAIRKMVNISLQREQRAESREDRAENRKQRVEIS